MTRQNLAGSASQSPVEATIRALRDTIRANEESIERQIVLPRDQGHGIQVYERRIRDIETLSATPLTLLEECGTSPEQPMYKAAVIEGEEGIRNATEYQRE
jgi:hypothetical protein